MGWDAKCENAKHELHIHRFMPKFIERVLVRNATEIVMWTMTVIIVIIMK